MTANITTELRLGIDAARAGQKEKARPHLIKVLKQDPRNIAAMLWLAFAAASPQESVMLLEHVLALDPQNRQARAGLQWAKNQLAADQSEPEEASTEESQSPPAQSAEQSPEQPDEFIRQQLLSKKEMRQQAKKGAMAHRARRTIDPLLTVAIVLGATAIFTLGIWVLALMPAETLAAWLPTPVEDVLVAAEPPAFVIKEPRLASDALAQSAPSKHLASESDTIALHAPAPLETKAPEANISTPVDVPDPATELNELAPVAEESEALMSLAPEANAPVVEAPPEASLPIIAPEQFIGPADQLLTGPRLFEPVDEALLAHKPASPAEKWIEVNVTEQRVTAWEGNMPVMSFVSSTGLPNTPTVLGEYNIYWKLESTLMAGPGYYLPEVPYTMYFYAGYALHGAYWHDNFGNPMSHGCVNLRPENAKELFDWAGPVIPPGQTQVTASANNPGTLVVVHE